MESLNKHPSDQLARDQALDTSQSFIVQAPAGSGKTGLLTLRFLKLLSISEQPEQVLAITFTRKAASEMRDRIISTLWWATELHKNNGTAENTYDALRLEVANSVLRRDEELQWQLLNNPTRLRVQTIDSFCFYLANRLPVLSRIGGNPNVSDDVDQCFRDAIANTLAQLESDSAISADIERVLNQLDNDTARIERLLIGLLRNRDQWLPYILELGSSSSEAKKYLQSCLDELIIESINDTRESLEPYSESLLALLNYSATNLQQENSPAHENFSPLSSLPNSTSKALPDWQFVIDLLIVKAGSWRKVVNKTIGFPPGDSSDKDHQALCKLRKQEFAELKENFTDNDDLLESINYLRLLPDNSIDDDQWNFLTALTRVLAQLSGELLISFRKHRLVDYTETGAAARSALGSESEPTDLALALDHRINHILVDEFQDTSQLQLEILQQLTGGWEPNDFRTLFLVGDAMQSCYGFRNANVGIYLNVQQHGLPQVSLQQLQLSANFRSDSGVVDWVNKHFSSAFPAQANISRGAVPYSSSRAVKPADLSSAITTEIITYNDEDKAAAKEEEAKRVIKHIQQLKLHCPTASIAILVRGRAHLSSIIPALRDSDIKWRSTDIDRMQALQTIEDLLSLTKALLNPVDRLSWLAILRAPWVGLQSSDLLVIATAAEDKSIWSILNNLDAPPLLSTDAKQRLQSFVEAISYGMHYRYRVSLRELVETTWCLLRGAASLSSNQEITSTRQYFVLLREHENAGGLNNIAQFQEKVFSSFIPAAVQNDSASNASPVQLLTMHKAKGLEFDHVIIPGLNNQPKSDDKSLFEWRERINKQAQSRLFVAALGETGEGDDKLYSLLRHEKHYKTLLENTRLLYIAITRAKKSVKLIATTGLNPKQEPKISSSSLLSRIWREIQREALEHVSSLQISAPELLSKNDTAKSNFTQQSVPIPTPILRFDQAPSLAAEERLLLQQQITAVENESAEKEEALQTEQGLNATTGSLIHMVLEEYTNSLDKKDFLSTLETQKQYWELVLRDQVSSQTELLEALKFIDTTLEKLFQSSELKWVFSNDYQDCHSEYSITSLYGGKTRSHVIDRTLIDAENVRWVIDYKTGVPSRETEEDFIELQKVAHEPQLQRYRSLFAELETRETKTALLFTGIQRLVEV
jgi:ATP-dependent helicase/nuclease subunit A